MEPAVVAALIMAAAVLLAAWLGRPRSPGRGDDGGGGNADKPDNKKTGGHLNGMARLKTADCGVR
jgi:hypothetical protein